jgi:hypothetical protein
MLRSNKMAHLPVIDSTRPGAGGRWAGQLSRNRPSDRDLPRNTQDSLFAG